MAMLFSFSYETQFLPLYIKGTWAESSHRSIHLSSPDWFSAIFLHIYLYVVVNLKIVSNIRIFDLTQRTSLYPRKPFSLVYGPCSPVPLDAEPISCKFLSARVKVFPANWTPSTNLSGDAPDVNKYFTVSSYIWMSGLKINVKYFKRRELINLNWWYDGKI